MLEQEEENVSAIEKCPVYLLIYICGFLSDGGNVRAVCRTWASAVQQYDLLNSYLNFYNAEWINHYITPLFETIQSLASFPIQLDTVVDQCTSVVKQSIETNIITTSPISKQKDGLRYFVYENCSLYFKTNFSKWIDSTIWYGQSYMCSQSDTGANSDVDDDDLNDINDNDLNTMNDDFEEDDGFRYFETADDEEMGELPRYKREMREYEEEEIEKRDMGYFSSAREVSRTREELGYLNLLDDSD